MGLSNLKKKNLKVTRGFTYNYYTSPAQDDKPTLILFHGWPDLAKTWADFINNHLVPNGYGVVAVDNLGFGETSRPTNLDAYAWNLMSQDLVEILDKEKLETVISVGHDWGSVVCQRLYNFFPSRVTAVILINVSYIPPTGDFDLEAVNKATKEAHGYGIYEYWDFNNADDGHVIMNKYPESVYTVEHGHPDTWIVNFCSPGGMRNYLSQGLTQPTMPYATAEHKADFMENFRQHGFESSLCYYKAYSFGIQNAADNLIPAQDKIIKVPVLFWGGRGDVVCRADAIKASIEGGYLPDVKEIVRDGGHYAFLEQPDVFGQDVVGWLKALGK
ncbi:Alpha/Beta hydrolase protein [Stachybotrys elegans]|uniref:Alpha/Beta hydrolase protein n=1 Tax=Stachybotrys elegans TaxID=80388 RepID=A0A8K0SWA8_9HYPO|nr:Alpha/Beta hydrolase protein [Stachybotrys elegans]